MSKCAVSYDNKHGNHGSCGGGNGKQRKLHNKERDEIVNESPNLEDDLRNAYTCMYCGCVYTLKNKPLGFREASSFKPWNHTN